MANLTCAVVWEVLLLHWPYNSTVYAVAWCSGMALIFSFAASLTWDAICFIPIRSLIIIPSVAIACLLSYKTHPSGIFGWIQAVSASIELLCAIPTGIGAAYQTGTARKIALTLSLMWLAQALYDYGFELHIGSPWWISLNGVLPTMIVVAACLWLSIVGRNGVRQATQ
jgi:hypothetical protein